MGLFGKKKRKGPVPVDVVQDYVKSGMNDKEIIKRLKSKGYSYDEIEKAMMEAVKESVDEPKGSRAPDLHSMPFEQSQQQELDFGITEAPAENINPEIIIDELVEGVVSEKWEKIDKRLADFEDKIEKIATHPKTHSEVLKTETISRDIESRITEFSDRLDEIEARVGGLEKAFRQFLPSLTKNVESLSHIIHELKERRAEPSPA